MEVSKKREKFKKYVRSQISICFESNLFKNKCQNRNNTIMLFAEIFPFFVEIFGLDTTYSMILNYVKNFKPFKKWLSEKKSALKEKLGHEPTFHDIGKWIGKGFFLKICLNLIFYNKMIIDKKIMKGIIKKQKIFLKTLYNIKSAKIIQIKENCYYLLEEKVINSISCENFYFENLIY